MIKTRITELLGTKYPITMGAMQWLTLAEFVSLVANAGGTSYIVSAAFKTGDELVAEIRKCKSLTKNPFGVNISMFPSLVEGEKTMEFAEVCVQEKVPFVNTSGRNPDQLVPFFHKHGIKVIHKVSAARFAEKAQSIGADAVEIIGYEAAGHPGLDEVGSFVTMPSTISKLSIPVVAGGGVCDGKSMAAALAFGAEGIVMGTRFIATKDAPVHQNVKDLILKSKETDTMIIQKSIRNASRCYRNNHTMAVLGMEQTGAQLKDIMPMISGARGRKAWDEGVLEDCCFTVGQNIGLINDLPTIQELVERTMKECEETIKKMQGLVG